MSVKIPLTEETPYVTCSANFILLQMMGSVSDSSLLQVPVPILPAKRVIVAFSSFHFPYSSKTWVETLRNYWSLLTKGGVREDKRYGQVVQ